MNVAKLKEHIEGYKTYLKKDRDFEWIHIWESAHNFKLKWEIAAPELDKMFDAALRNETTQRLWQKEDWTPKQAMIKLSAYKPEKIREIFEEFFADIFDTPSRIVYFKKEMDSLLTFYNKKHPLSRLSGHYHLDNEMIFLYLAFNFPDQFTLWNFEAFYKMMMSLEVREAPTPYDISRFISATNIWNTFIEKDPEIEPLIKKRLRPALQYLSNSRLKVFEFYMVQMNQRL